MGTTLQIDSERQPTTISKSLPVLTISFTTDRGKGPISLLNYLSYRVFFFFCDNYIDIKSSFSKTIRQKSLIRLTTTFSTAKSTSIMRKYKKNHNYKLLFVNRKH